MKRTFVMTFVFVLAVVFTITALDVNSPFFRRLPATIQWILLGCPAFIVMAYGVISGFFDRRNLIQLNHLADEVYFAGYFCTIISLTYVIMMAKVGGLNTQDCLQGAGIGLTTTAMGLLIFAAIRRYAMSLMSVTTDEIKMQVIAHVSPLLESVAAEAKVASVKFKEMNGEFELLNSNLSKFKDEISFGTTSAQFCKTQFDGLAEAMRAVVEASPSKESLKGIADGTEKAAEFAKTIGTTTDSVGKLGDKAEAASGRVHSLGASAGLCGGEFDKAKDATAEYNQAVKELEQVLRMFAKLNAANIVAAPRNGGSRS